MRATRERSCTDNQRWVSGIRDCVCMTNSTKEIVFWEELKQRPAGSGRRTYDHDQSPEHTSPVNIQLLELAGHFAARTAGE